MANEIAEINARVQEESRFAVGVKQAISKVIVGQEDLVDRLLIALLCRGHVLVEGVPGLAKSLAVKSLADAIDVSFVRVQFTPDLLPADLTGTMVFNPKDAEFHVRKGPVFNNLVLADEVNRAPAKVQSALLEAMQERQVSIGGSTFPLDEPFMVLATQNPIEQEGTYPLPEAQLDRFMLKVLVRYPSRLEEKQILELGSVASLPEIEAVAGADDIARARDSVLRVHLDESLKDYITEVVFATREPANYQLPDLATMIAYGASPRATIYLAQASRAHAFINGRGHVLPEDIKTIAPDVLRHRVILTYEAEAEELTSDDLVQRVLSSVAVP